MNEKIKFFSCLNHFVEGYGRTTCPYCEDGKHDYEPYTRFDGDTFVMDATRQIKTLKELK